MHLLVLDDDPATSQLAARVAAAVGFTCDATTDAVAFRQHYAAALPDMVMLDLQQPDADGIEQLRFLANHGYRGPLILVSGFDAQVLDTVQELSSRLGLNVVGTIAKPIRGPALRAMLHWLYERSMPPSAERLQRALDDGELRMENQPIVDCRSRQLRKLEALVRWESPSLGRLAPEQFIAVAEANTWLMHKLTGWVIDSAIRACASLRTRGVAVPVAVNVSPNNITPEFPHDLDRLLREHGLAASDLSLEITETAAFRDPLQTREVLNRLRLRGIGIAIDDFGTGYSSLKLLRELPFTAIKIDRSFVSDLTESRDSRAIVASIIDLATNMELESIAEGVETEACAQQLENLGIDLLQGYLLGRPMAADELPAWAQVNRSRMRFIANAEPSAADPTPTIPGCDDTANGMKLLTPRQQVVMQLLADGFSVKQIARQLELGIGTVKTHLSLAYSVLGAHSRIEALQRAGLTNSAS